MADPLKGYFQIIQDGQGNSGKLYVRDGHMSSPFGETAEECDKLFDDLQLFNSRQDDVWICAFAKSGTHWVWEMVSMLLATSSELIEYSKGCVMLENNDAETIESAASPRVLNTHYSVDILPSGMWKAKNKVIHVVRNLKDVLVSYYHHKLKLGSYSGTFAAYLDLYNESVNKKWYAYEREWVTAHRDNPDVLLLKYEDMIKDHLGTIRKISQFLSLPPNEDHFQRVLEKTKIQNMRTNKKEAVSNVFYRKGKVGDWKNYFTVAMSEKFDIEYAEEMKDVDLELDLE